MFCRFIRRCAIMLIFTNGYTMSWFWSPLCTHNSSMFYNLEDSYWTGEGGCKETILFCVKTWYELRLMTGLTVVEMGFSAKWVQYIAHCVTTVSFSVLVNTSQRWGVFFPSCCLFILVLQALPSSFAAFASLGVCKGISMRPPISLPSPLCRWFFRILSCVVLNTYCHQAGQY